MRWIGAAVLALASVGVGQEPERDRGFGRVQDAAGKPWVGAKVVLIHRIHDSVRDAAHTDRIETVTDDKGRFRAELLVGARYLAWATDGSTGVTLRRTKIRYGAIARTPILLAEQAPSYRRRLRITGHPTFANVPIRWVASMRAGRNFISRPLQADADGAFTLTGWPADYTSVVAWAEGWPVFSLYLPHTEAEVVRRGVHSRQKLAAGQDPKAALTAILEVALPPRQEQWANVVGQDDQQPVVGARVVFDGRRPVLGVPVSDAKGRIRVVYAAQDPEKRTYFQAALQVEGYAENSLRSSHLGEGKKATRVLLRGKTVRGRIQLGDARVKNLPVLLDGSIGVGNGTTWFGVDARVLRTDAEGALAVPGRIPAYPYRLTAVLSPRIRALLRGEGRSVPPIAPLAILSAEKNGPPKDLGEVRLDQLRHVDVTVTQPDGTPPGSVRVLVMPLAEAYMSSRPHNPLTAYTDRRGRVRVLVGDAKDLFVYTATREAAAWKVVTAQEKSARMKLDPRHRVTFRLVGAEGKPLVGYSVGYVSPKRPGSNVPKRVLDVVRDLSSYQAFASKYGTTDAKGLVSLITPLLDVQLDLSVTAKKREDGDGRIIVPVPPDHGGEPILLEPTLRRRR